MRLTGFHSRRHSSRAAPKFISILGYFTRGSVSRKWVGAKQIRHLCCITVGSFSTHWPCCIPEAEESSGVMCEIAPQETCVFLMRQHRKGRPEVSQEVRGPLGNIYEMMTFAFKCAEKQIFNKPGSTTGRRGRETETGRTHKGTDMANNTDKKI